MSVEKKGLRGEAITILVPADSPFAIALVGDSEVVIAGYVSHTVSCLRVAEEVLAVRAGGRPSLLAGPLGKSLGDVPADAHGLLRGALPRLEFAIPLARSSLGAAPRQLAVDLLSPK